MSNGTNLNNLRISYQRAMKTLTETKSRLIDSITHNDVDIVDLLKEYNAQVDAVAHLQDMMNETVGENHD